MLGGFLFLWSVRYRTEPGMSDGCLIGPDGFLKQRYIKEWELYHPFDLVLAMIGSIRRQMPEQQPLIRAKVK